jgi:hypothetical protein
MFKLLSLNILRISTKAKPIRFIPMYRTFTLISKNNKKKEMSEFNKFFLQQEDEIPETTLPTKQMISIIILK